MRWADVGDVLEDMRKSYHLVNREVLEYMAEYEVWLTPKRTLHDPAFIRKLLGVCRTERH